MSQNPDGMRTLMGEGRSPAGCDTLPMNDALEAQRETRPAVKKISTVAIEGIQIFKENQLTVGLDLGDRTSHYCILNEAGEVIWEDKLPTTPTGIEEVFGRIRRRRITLETGTHSPWVSRQLNQLGHEAIVAHARNARLIGESSQNKRARYIWMSEHFLQFSRGL
jgi:hypothetical protein